MSAAENSAHGGSVAADSGTATNRPECTDNITEVDAYFRSCTISLDPAEEYKMDNKKRGRVLIFNQERFYWQLMMNNRHGTNRDRENLEISFKDLGFDVQVHDDLKRNEVLSKISEAAGDNHADADCFACIFLSHGENEHIYAYDDKISIKEITALFKGDKCRSLVGKPKIFILQACRGDRHDVPVTPMDVVDSEAMANQVVVDAGVVHTLPAGADFLMCYSVAEGYYSHRETVNGSWYIQDLCESLGKFGKSLELTELLTLVNRKVSLRRVGSSNDPNAIGKKQVPCFASMLTKKLYFRPKKNGST